MNVIYLNQAILCFATYFPPVNALPKKSVMRRGMRKPRGVKVIQYISCMVDINEYLTVLPGGKTRNKIGKSQLH